MPLVKQEIPEYTIREATREDVDILVAFTLDEAREAEGITLDARGVRRGVEGGFEEPRRAVYWVAEDSTRRVVASASVVVEWSNFHGGDYWWIQSLFVAPAHRGRGLVDRLIGHLADAARTSGALDLRLYARQSNERAQRVYRRCGFEPAPYVMMRKALGPDSAE